MNKNIGKIIKGLAYGMFIAETISAIITGIGLMASDDDWIAIGVLVMLAGPIVAFVLFCFIYGFGDLIDTNHAIEYNTRKEGLSYEEYINEEWTKAKAERTKAKEERTKAKEERKKQKILNNKKTHAEYIATEKKKQEFNSHFKNTDIGKTWKEKPKTNQPRYCKNCGTRIKDDTVVCGKCGTKTYR